MDRVRDKVVVITGGASGIGLAAGAVMTPALRDNPPQEAIGSIRGHNALPVRAVVGW